MECPFKAKKDQTLCNYAHCLFGLIRSVFKCLHVPTIQNDRIMSFLSHQVYHSFNTFFFFCLSASIDCCTVLLMTLKMSSIMSQGQLTYVKAIDVTLSFHYTCNSILNMKVRIWRLKTRQTCWERQIWLYLQLTVNKSSILFFDMFFFWCDTFIIMTDRKKENSWEQHGGQWQCYSRKFFDFKWLGSQKLLTGGKPLR